MSDEMRNDQSREQWFRDRIKELEAKVAASQARLVKVLSLTEASEQVESIVDELQSLSATNWQLSARLTAEREEHEAKLTAAEKALRVIAGGYTSEFPGAPDVMTATPEQFRSDMWTWSQKVAKSAITKVEGK